MKQLIISTGIVLAVFGLLFGFLFFVNGTEIAVARVFNPLHEEVRRQTFETSRAYREGLAQELQNMQLEYVQATPEQKDALASIILHRTAGVNLNWLPQDVQQFVTQLKVQKGLGQ